MKLLALCSILFDLLVFFLAEFVGACEQNVLASTEREKRERESERARERAREREREREREKQRTSEQNVFARADVRLRVSVRR
jgi:hypothetical protein